MGARETQLIGDQAMTISSSTHPAIFLYLDGLRESGSINMFHAAPILERVFSLTRYEARDVLFAWMKSKTQQKG
jgi:hypothetical protein